MRNTTSNISERPKRVATRKASQKRDENQENISKDKPIKKIERKRSCKELLSPNKVPLTRKRTAFGDVTNAIQAHTERLSMARQKKETGIKKVKLKAKVNPKKNLPGKISIYKPVEVPTKLDDVKTTIEGIGNNKENRDPNALDMSNSKTSIDTEKVLNISNVAVNGTTSNNTSLNVSLNSSIRPCPAISDEILKQYQSPKVKTPTTPKIRPYDTDNDPNNVCEYAESVFRNMKKREERFPLSNYSISIKNTSTTGPMRAILVDWLVEVQENFELYHETLYLAVKIVDNYLQKVDTPKELLQLVGATSLLVASKIEEFRPPPIDDFQFICDDAYTHKQFVKMELKILEAVDFDVNFPIPYRFLRRYAKVNGLSMQLLTLSRYLLELSLQEAQFIEVPPSKIAAACLCLALKMKDDEGDWDDNFVFHTTYKEKELIELMKSLNTMVEVAPNNKLQTVRTKYLHPIFHSVAKIPALDALSL